MVTEIEYTLDLLNRRGKEEYDSKGMVKNTFFIINHYIPRKQVIMSKNHWSIKKASQFLFHYQKTYP